MGVKLSASRSVALAVDVQRFAFRNIKAPHIKRVSVAQDQVRIVGDGYTVFHRHIPVQVVPSAVHVSVRRD